jgi:hypothetical protein
MANGAHELRDGMEKVVKEHQETKLTHWRLHFLSSFNYTSLLLWARVLVGIVEENLKIRRVGRPWQVESGVGLERNCERGAR